MTIYRLWSFITRRKSGAYSICDNWYRWKPKRRCL